MSDQAFYLQFMYEHTGKREDEDNARQPTITPPSPCASFNRTCICLSPKNGGGGGAFMHAPCEGG